MEFAEVVKKAKEIRDIYDAQNNSDGKQPWGFADYVSGLTGDVGELTVLTMMKKGLRRPVENLDDKIKHEVCDCLWATLMIAESLNIDLPSEFSTQMDLLTQRLTAQK